MERQILKQNFLKENDLSSANIIDMQADASFRTYSRIVLKDKSFILMDAPPDKEKLFEFINISKYLCGNGFSAPEIFASDTKNGFLLLEDFGDESFTKVLNFRSKFNSQYSEKDLYLEAIQILLELTKIPSLDSLPLYNDELLLNEVKLLIDWFMKFVVNIHLSDQAQQEYIDIWRELLKKINILPNVTVLRDYHADNLMWLPHNFGKKKIGLLDFQDAVIGSPLYDLVSLLEDIRRNISEDVIITGMKYYQESIHVSENEFLSAYYILAAQRNCKIIGIFSRLAFRDNKIKYLQFLPKTWQNLQRELEYPILSPLKKWLDCNIKPEFRYAN